MASPFTEIEVDDRVVKVTNPDRVYFPESGATKLDLVEYYLSVGEGIVNALFERPCMLHRFPKGLAGDKVHQKRLPAGAPPWVETVRLHFPRWNRTADELCVTELASVIWAVQMSTVEFHPWNSRRADTEKPDEWRIDLDPGPLSDFAQVQRVAGVVHEVLDELGAVGYPKTSGSKGLHVYVRIRARPRLPDVRRAAHAFAREIERRAPDDVTTEWWKKNRDPHHLFVDYNQNTRDHTIAAAYSVRGLPDARVSAPRSRWDEVPTATRTTSRSSRCPQRYAELGDLHHDIDGDVFDIAPLLEWAERDEAAGAEPARPITDADALGSSRGHPDHAEHPQRRLRGPGGRGGADPERRLGPRRRDGQPLRPEPHVRAHDGGGAVEGDRRPARRPPDDREPRPRGAGVRRGRRRLGHVPRRGGRRARCGWRASCAPTAPGPAWRSSRPPRSTPTRTCSPELDMVLLMTVEPGFGGQKFLDLVLPKIRRARELMDKHGVETWLQVDGGISLDTIERCAEAGADVFVAGSAVYCADDPDAMVTALREAAPPRADPLRRSSSANLAGRAAACGTNRGFPGRPGTPRPGPSVGHLTGRERPGGSRLGPARATVTSTVLACSGGGGTPHRR